MNPLHPFPRGFFTEHSWVLIDPVFLGSGEGADFYTSGYKHDKEIMLIVHPDIRKSHAPHDGWDSRWMWAVVHPDYRTYLPDKIPGPVKDLAHTFALLLS